MKQCELCGASLVEGASFCGKCGHELSQTAQRATSIDDLPTMSLENPPDENNQTILSASGRQAVPRTPSGILHPVTLIPIDDDEDDEEERRRRAALLDFSLPLLGELATQPKPGQAPSIQGAPQLTSAPSIAGTPPMGSGAGNPPVPSGAGSPAAHSLQAGSPAAHSLQVSQPPRPLFHPPQYRPPIRRPGGSTGGSTNNPASNPGCLALSAIFVAALLIILATFIGLGLTLWAPNLTLNGNTHVAPGGTLLLHGSNFLPNSSVTLTLDGGVPLFFSQYSAPRQLANEHTQYAASAEYALHPLLVPAAKNVISVHGDGTFNATVVVNPTWAPGQHTIHAAESVSHRSASLPFTIMQAGSTATPAPTATATVEPTATATATSRPTATPTAAPVLPSTLTCATPGNLKLGPVSEFSSQTDSERVTLCTAGSGVLTWKANWDKNKAPWLQMSQSSGTIQAPGQTQVTIGASALHLAAGTYTVPVIFTGLESNTSQTVNVSFGVSAGCVSSTPRSLSFTGVEGISDPASAQTFSITNCGMTSDWSAKIDNGSSWLSINPGKGTLKGNATSTITVTASNLNAGLKAGNYQDTITVRIGSDTTQVVVSLIVQAAPTISASPTSVDAASTQCTNDNNGNSVCAITLANNSSSAPLTWSSASSVGGVTVQANSTTISAGGSEQVTIIVPGNDCGTQVTVTFTGPSNSASVTWNCRVPG